jgi:hypothetical protein
VYLKFDILPGLKPVGQAAMVWFHVAVVEPII